MIARFTGFSAPVDGDAPSIGGKNLLDAVLSRAKDRGGMKRKQDAENGKMHDGKDSASTSASPAKNKNKEGKKARTRGRKSPLGPQRVESREERESRKAALKQAKRDRKAAELTRQGDGADDKEYDKEDDGEDEEENKPKVVVAKKDKKQKKQQQEEEQERQEAPPTATASASATKTEEVEVEAAPTTGVVSPAAPPMSTLLALKKSHMLNQAGLQGAGLVARSKKTGDEDDILDAVLSSDVGSGAGGKSDGVGHGGAAAGGLTMTSTKPMAVAAASEAWGLSPSLARNLAEDCITDFFPVQCAVIPALLRGAAEACIFPRDLCVSAPTGSGKTIAYALPIIQTLSLRAVPRLSAVIILPSRELAAQVYRVFCRLARESTGTVASSSGQALRVLLSTGRSTLEEEQALLHNSRPGSSTAFLAGRAPDSGPPRLTPRNSAPTGRVDWAGRPIFGLKQDAGAGAAAHTTASHDEEEFECRGVDVMICTPARLLEHIDGTIGFSLKHLRYLVLDEADRLLGNAYHSWVTALVRSCVSDTGNSSSASDRDHAKSAASLVGMRPLQRLLFSATLTDNPRKLALLGIHNPILVRAPAAILGGGVAAVGDAENGGGEQPTMYTLPGALSESVCTVEAATRPAQLIALLVEAFRSRPTGVSAESMEIHPHMGLCSGKEGKSMVLIFVSSVESTHRLCRLLQLFNRQAAEGLTQKEDFEEDDDDEGEGDGEDGIDVLVGGELAE
jgi:ATP-dependent RNA helicase DDX51/DBP6